MTGENHHVVSAGYQRLFAEGELILYIDKKLRQAHRIGVKNAFRVRHFTSVNTDLLGDLQVPSTGWDNKLETTLSGFEDQILPALKRLSSGTEEPTDFWRASQGVALHMTRSYGLYDIHAEVYPQWAPSAVDELLAQPDVVEGYSELFGHLPTRDDIFAVYRRFGKSRAPFLEAMKQLFMRLQLHFYRMRASLAVAPSGYGFVYGDSPVLYWDGLKLGLRERAQWGRASEFFMPISRTHGLFLHWGTRASTVHLAPSECVKQNNLEWRATKRFLGCHPEDDPSVLLDRSIEVRRR